MVIRCCSLTGYINHSGKYIEINFNMKIPFLLLGRYARSIQKRVRVCILVDRDAVWKVLRLYGISGRLLRGVKSFVCWQ